MGAAASAHNEHTKKWESYNMSFLGKRQRLAAVTACVALGVASLPFSVNAAEMQVASANAGVTAIFESKLTEEEYMELAKQAQGASWGYTHIGIANVESGNLNVREEPSTSGKLVGKMSKDAACEVLIPMESGHIFSPEKWKDM